jgi:hypothetical protein
MGHEGEIKAEIAQFLDSTVTVLNSSR